jgi:hypothetical protein
MRSSALTRISRRDAVLAIGLAMLSHGCEKRAVPPDANVTPAPSPAPSPAPPPVPIVASFASLSGDVLQVERVRWEVGYTLATLAKLVYEEDELAQVFQAKKIGATRVEPISNGLSHGLVASDDRAVVIAFRGTTVRADWLTNGTIISRRFPDGRVHRGFYDATDAVYKDVIAETIKQGGRDKVIWVTGHSLGGAMAAACGYRLLTEKGMRPRGVVTFGQPLLFGRSYAQTMLNEFKDEYVRFVNRYDKVSRLLPNYIHAGARVHLFEDHFDLREPQLAYSKAPGAPPTAAPDYHFFEDDPELQPMTDAEFQAFEKELRAEQSPATATPGVYGAGFWSVLEPHSMDTYLERIQMQGQQAIARSRIGTD